MVKARPVIDVLNETLNSFIDELEMESNKQQLLIREQNGEINKLRARVLDMGAQIESKPDATAPRLVAQEWACVEIESIDERLDRIESVLGDINSKKVNCMKMEVDQKTIVKMDDQDMQELCLVMTHFSEIIRRNTHGN